MLVDSPFVGDWKAAAYLWNGVRIENALSMHAEGDYRWHTVHEGRGEPYFDEGTWRHEGDCLCFTPSKPGPVDGEENPQVFRILQLPGFEDSPLMILRRVALASRNLPLFFYRVHPKREEDQAYDEPSRAEIARRVAEIRSGQAEGISAKALIEELKNQ